MTSCPKTRKPRNYWRDLERPQFETIDAATAKAEGFHPCTCPYTLRLYRDCEMLKAAIATYAGVAIKLVVNAAGTAIEIWRK